MSITGFMALIHETSDDVPLKDVLLACRDLGTRLATGEEIITDEQWMALSTEERSAVFRAFLLVSSMTLTAVK